MQLHVRGRGEEHGSLMTTAVLSLPYHFVLLVSECVEGVKKQSLLYTCMLLQKCISDTRRKAGQVMNIVIADTIHRHDQLWGGNDVRMSCPSIMRSPSYFHLHNKILASVLVWWTNKTGFMPSRSCMQEFPVLPTTPHRGEGGRGESFLVGFHDRMCSF